MEKAKHIESLQVLRAIAVILVLLFHVSGIIQSQLGYAFAAHLFQFGYTGVDIFFVLSGFIICYTSSDLSARSFLWRRFIRIYPIYWIALLFTLVMVVVANYVLHIPCANSSTCASIASGGLKVVLESWFLIPNATPVIGVSWTLSYEVGFYLLFGTLYFRYPKIFMAALVAWALVAPIAWEFVFGCIIAKLISSQQVKSSKPLYLLLGMILFSLSAYFLAGDDVGRELNFGLPAALILYGLLHIKTKFSAVLTYLGDASYSIYLFHFPLLGLCVKLLFIFKIAPYMNNFIGMILILLIVTTMCCGIYSWIERPLLAVCRMKHRQTSAITTPNIVLHTI